jgi:hypothetical protein
MDGTPGFTEANPCNEIGNLDGLGYQADTKFRR